MATGEDYGPSSSTTSFSFDPDDPFGLGLPTFDFASGFGFEEDPSSSAAAADTLKGGDGPYDVSGFGMGMLDPGPSAPFDFSNLEIDFDALNDQMGKVLEGIDFNFDMNGGSDSNVERGPRPVEDTINPSQLDLSGIVNNPPVSLLDFPELDFDFPPAVAAGDNNDPPQNGQALFPARDEQFLLPTPSPPSAAHTHGSSESNSSTSPPYFPPLSPALSSSASEAPNNKLIWPIPVDAHGVPHADVLRILGFPPLGGRRARIETQIEKAGPSRIHSHSLEAESSSSARKRAHSPYADERDRDAPTEGPTKRTAKGKAKAPASSDADASLSPSSSAITDTEKDSNTWHVITAPSPIVAAASSLAAQNRANMARRFGGKKRNGGIVFQKNLEGRPDEKRPEWREPIQPWAGFEDGEGGKEPCTKMRDELRAKRLVFVRLREDVNRNVYGWAVGQLHVSASAVIYFILLLSDNMQDPLTNRYLILSGPHTLSFRTVRNYDTLPYSNENVAKLKDGQKNEKVYPELVISPSAISKFVKDHHARQVQMPLPETRMSG